MLGPLPHFKNNLGMMGNDESPDTVGLLEWDGPGFEETVFFICRLLTPGPSYSKNSQWIRTPEDRGHSF